VPQHGTAPPSLNANEDGITGDAIDAHVDVHDVADVGVAPGNLHPSDDGNLATLLVNRSENTVQLY